MLPSSLPEEGRGRGWEGEGRGRGREGEGQWKEEEDEDRDNGGIETEGTLLQMYVWYCKWLSYKSLSFYACMSCVPTFLWKMLRGGTGFSSPWGWVRISPSTRLAIAVESAFRRGD